MTNASQRRPQVKMRALMHLFVAGKPVAARTTFTCSAQEARDRIRAGQAELDETPSAGAGPAREKPSKA